MTGNKLVMQICESINWLFFDEVSIESFEEVKYPEMINFITLEKSYAFILFWSENKSCSSKYYSYNLNKKFFYHRMNHFYSSHFNWFSDNIW